MAEPDEAEATMAEPDEAKATMAEPDEAEATMAEPDEAKATMAEPDEARDDPSTSSGIVSKHRRTLRQAQGSNYRSTTPQGEPE